MQAEKVRLNEYYLIKLIVFFLVTRVRSHGYVQVVFNIVTKDIESLGYRIEAKHSTTQQRADNQETNHVENYHS